MSPTHWPSVIRRHETGNPNQPVVFTWACETPPESTWALVLEVFGGDPGWALFSGCDDDCPEYLPFHPEDEAAAVQVLWEKGSPVLPDAELLPADLALLEALADLEHEQWAHWTRYMLGVLQQHDVLWKIVTSAGGGPQTRKLREHLTRWDQQMGTVYGRLTDAEKESDREWARRVLQVVKLPEFEYLVASHERPERVLCAAIYVDTGKPEERRSHAYPATGLVFSGWRHGDCFTTMNAWAAGLTPEEREAVGEEQLHGRHQGFITSKGRYVDRAEALLIAQAAGQVRPERQGDLWSEDLY